MHLTYIFKKQVQQIFSPVYSPLSVAIFYFFLPFFLNSSEHLTVPETGNPTNAQQERFSSAISTGPVSLSYASYYGQSINNAFTDVVVDNSGNIYATGTTISQGFDAVLVKFNASGVLLWEKFIGGSDAENFNSNDSHSYGKIALDNSDNIYITGITASDDFPILNAFQANRGGGIDAFITKLDSDGNILMSSFLGGSNDENFGGSGGIDIDNNGNIYIAGATFGTGFFDTSNAFQSGNSGGTNSDAFVVKISADFSTVSGTFWGDDSIDVLRDLEIADNGTIWAAGYATESSLSLPGQQPLAIDGADGILLGFNADLSSLSQGTFFGGQFDEEINGIAIDGNGDILISGGTFSTNDFPTLAAFQSSYAGGQEAFAAKLNDNTQLIWSTFLGASQNEVANDITVDNANNVIITGATSSIDFPVHRSAQQTYNTLNCKNDAFVFKFNEDGTRDWSTFYGGWQIEHPGGIAVNNLGQVILAGKTESTDLPITANAHQSTTLTSGVNAFLSIFEITCPSQPIIIHSTENATFHDQFWCNRYESDYAPYFQSDTCALQLIAPPGYTNYSWLKNGTPVSGESNQRINISNPYSATALPEYQVILDGGNDCTDPSTSVSTAIQWVRPMCGFGSSFDETELPHPARIIEGTQDVILCPGESVNTTLSAEGFCGATFQWQKDFVDIPGANDQFYQVSSPGCYRVAVINSFTNCEVYSITKKFILLNQVLLNDYYANQPASCEIQDSITGCSNVFIRARVPNCAACDRSLSQGLTYSFYRDGVFVTSNSYGYHSTTIEGIYTVEVSNGTCSISSNTIVASIRPTEKPIWTNPTDQICIQGTDSITFSVSHPAIGDSATLRFDLPYPATDIITMDSFVRVATSDLEDGCIDVRLTTRDGCLSVSDDIELHDTITPVIQVDGPPCVPVRLRSQGISSCHLDSVFWYLEDSIVYSAGYDASYIAQASGNYRLRIKNTCGDFTSDTTYLSDQLAAPVLNPGGPICLPVSLGTNSPESNTIVKWYRNPFSNYCVPNNNYLIPDQTDTSYIANLPGFYFATFEDTLTGCKSTCSNIVEVQRSVAGANLTPSNDIYYCEGTSSGNVTFTVSPSSPSYTYQWYKNNNPITGATSAAYTTNEQGVYRVFLENSCDNAFTPVVNIFSVLNPVLSITGSDTIYLCGPDTIRFDTESNQPLIFEWYQDDVLIVDAVDSFYLATTPGKYQVYGLNNNTQCEEWSQEVYIINSTPMTSTVMSTPSCSGACSGSLTANVIGGTPFSNGTYLYEWQTGETSESLSNICPGSYKVTVTDAIGCTQVAEGVISNGFSATTSIDSISCANANDGLIQLQVNGGTPPFAYNWNNGSTGNFIENLSPGIYSVTVTDAQNCTLIDSTTLTVPDAIDILLNAIDASCVDASDGKISANISGGSPPYQLQWGSPVLLDSAMLSADNYTLTVTDQKGCQKIDSILVNAPTAISLDLSIANILVCENSTDGAINSSVSGGTPPYSYSWADGPTNPNRNNLSAGTYIVSIADSNQCYAVDSITLNPAVPLDFTVSDVTNLSCWNADDGELTIHPTGGAQPYSYFVNEVSHSDSMITNLRSGDYTIYILDSNNCRSTDQNISIQTPDSLTASVITTSATCRGNADGTATISVSGGTADYVYEWSNGNDSNAANQLSASTYLVTINDVNACQNIISIEVEEPDSLISSFSISDVSCKDGTDGAINIINTSGGTAPYNYYLDSGATPVSNQGLDLLEDGIYILKTVDSHGCERTDSLEITEPEELSLSLNIEQALTCFGGSDGSIASTVTGGTLPYSYAWENGTTNNNTSNLTSGFHQVTVTDAQGCTAVENIFLEDGPFIVLIVEEVNSISCAGANDGNIRINGNGGTAPYTYFVNDLPHNENYFENLAPGDYELYTQDANGCLSQRQIIEINEPLALQVGVVSSAVVCPGDNNGIAEIIASGGTVDYSYQWSDLGFGDRAENLIAGNYSVTVSDAQGCTEVIAFEITSPAPINTQIVAMDNQCFEEKLGTIHIQSSTGGTAPFSYYLNSELLSNDSLFVDQLVAGTYELITIDSQNCALNQEIIISEPDLFELNLGEDIRIKLGENIPLPLDIINGVGTPIFEISPNDFINCEAPISLDDCPNPTVESATRNMAYQITLTDENGCIATDDIQIFVDRTANHVFVPNIFSPNNDGKNDLFFVQANGSVDRIIQFSIFDRWGSQVFSASNFAPNDESQGWNGRLKGKALMSGVYIWTVEYQTIDGSQRRVSGDLTLRR